MMDQNSMVSVNLDIRGCKPDRDAFLDAKAPQDAPNVLVILYDDTGCTTTLGRRPGRDYAKRK